MGRGARIRRDADAEFHPKLFPNEAEADTGRSNDQVTSLIARSYPTEFDCVFQPVKRLLDGLHLHLKSCPLFCTLLCVLYEEEGDRSVNKFTEIYSGIITWLIRGTHTRLNPVKSAWNAASEAKYDKALSHFGSLCLEILAKGQVQFTAEQLAELPGIPIINL